MQNQKETDNYKDKYISENCYFSYPALSKSQIREWDDDYPQGFWRYCAFNPEKKEKDMTSPIAIGNTAHTLVFEPEKLATHYLITDEYGRGKLFRNNKIYKEAILDPVNRNKIIINSSEYEKAKEMIAELKKHPLIPAYLKFGKPELPFVWYDKEFKIWCKAKIDWFRGAYFVETKEKGVVVFDYKTTGTFQTFIRNAYTNKCYVDAGFYERMVRHKFGKEVPFKMIFIIQSTKDGEYDRIAIRYLDEYSMNFAREAVSQTMNKVTKRLELCKAGDPSAWLPKAEERNWEIPVFAHDKHFNEEE